MQKKTTLIFDLGNVIINLKPDAVWHKQDLLPNFNIEKLYELEADLFFNAFETGKISTIDFLQQLKKIANDVDISDSTIKAHWNAILLDIPPHRIDLLYQLKQKYNLALLSNTNEIHLNHVLDELKNNFGQNIFNDIFDQQFYSQQIGMRKPDLTIYEYVLQHNSALVSDIYFFDDKPENLIEPNKLGIHTILVDKDIAELTTFLL